MATPDSQAGAPAAESTTGSIEVVAGGLFDAAGRVLIAQRPPGKPLAGRWEFPGGKLLAGEDPYAGLVRELQEELGVEVRAATRLMRYAHRYPERTVWLDMWLVSGWRGEVHAHDGQVLAWVEPTRLAEYDILEADAPIVEAIQHPEKWLDVGFRPPGR